jgi:hypothetical protein
MAVAESSRGGLFDLSGVNLGSRDFDHIWLVLVKTHAVCSFFGSMKIVLGSKQMA